MNERIRELAIKANAKVIGDQFKYMKMYEDDIEKFAELLIQECITVVEDMSPGYKDYRDQIEDAFRRDCIFEIKHKFGLPE